MFRATSLSYHEKQPLLR